MVSNESPDLEWLKNKLKRYNQEEIGFHDPHFTYMLDSRDGTKEEVIQHILNPDDLVYYTANKGKYGDLVYCLYFEISNTKTMMLPIIFDRRGRKFYIY